MSLTLKLIYLIDKFKLGHYFAEEKKTGHIGIKVFEFDPAKLEKRIDQIIKTKGHAYAPNELEQKIMEELNF